MTPEEAADIVETVVDRWSPEQKRALRVVLDHAHAAVAFEGDTAGPTRDHLDRAIELCSSLPTPPPTDILIRHAKATRHYARATGHDAKSRGPEYWRGHADGKLEQQATAASGPTDEELAAKLDGVIPGGGGWFNVAEVRNALRARHAPEPVAPPAVGDTVEAAAQLDALPVGAVVRDKPTFLIAWRHVNGWSTSREDAPAETREFLVDKIERGARFIVLDLPEVTS